MKKNIFLITLVIFALAISSFAFAEDATGAETTVGTSESGTATTSGTVDATGGNVTEVNITANAITTNWAGFWGSIEGTLKLADTANTFYEWTVSDMTGAYVYAADAAVSTWDLAAATNANMPAGVSGTNTDSYANTFDVSEEVTLLGNAITADYAVTLQDGAATDLKTYALTADTGATTVFAGEAQNDATGFNAKTVDYQIIAPAAGSTTYNFYLELP